MKAILGAIAVTFLMSTSAFAGPMSCVAEIGQLDANDDGFVSANEASGVTGVMANVDIDGDGRISPQEAVVVCQTTSLNDVFEPKQ
jgi:hypothetical protein